MGIAVNALLLLILLTPSLQFVRPISNHILVASSILLMSLAYSPKLGKVAVAFLVCICILLPFLGLSGVTLPFVGLLLAIISYILASRLGFCELPLLLAIVIGTNSAFAFLQLMYPDLNLSNINAGYQVSDHSLSSIANLVPLPSLGRLRGIYNENGPMVTYTTLHLFSLVILLRMARSFNLFSLRYSSARLFLEPAKSLVIMPIVFFGLAVVFLTGSKSVFSAAVFLLLAFFMPLTPSRSLWSVLRPGKIYSLYNYLVRLAFLFALMLFLIYFFAHIYDYIVSSGLATTVASVSRFRVSTDYQIWHGVGLLPSSDGQAQSLSAYAIYPLAFGIVPAALLLSSYITLLSYGALPVIFCLFAMVSFLSSGSLLSPLYFQIVLISFSFKASIAAKQFL
jgi:hypothetical protein